MAATESGGDESGVIDCAQQGNCHGGAAHIYMGPPIFFLESISMLSATSLRYARQFNFFRVNFVNVVPRPPC